jgi:molecular chaperone DnaK
MRLGIDFGTTRTVVAATDRGNYPVIGFETPQGEHLAWYPAAVAARDGELAYGLDTLARHDEPGWFFLRSIKPLLASAGPDDRIAIGTTDVPLLDLLTGYLTRLREDLQERSNLSTGAYGNGAPQAPPEAWIAVPANANSNQRFLTLEGFRRAGFKVMGMLNEPSAAGIEFAHRYVSPNTRKEYLAVYDLGGGTFDVSVIGILAHHYEVLTGEGVASLGGEDFDAELLALALERAGLAPEPNGLDPQTRYHLLEECRERKEGLHPNTRKVAVDLSLGLADAGEVVVPVDAFYARCAPLIARSVEATERAVTALPQDAEQALAAVYLVGGSCELPAVARQMRERYGRRVRRSPYPHAATAIGLAVAADADRPLAVSERFTRHFGVWREAQAGRCIVFDPIFPKDTPLPAAGDPPLTLTRRYAPHHNLAHFRYLECSRLDPDSGQPGGDITPWDEVLFPLDPDLTRKRRLDRIPVERTERVADQVIEERYACDARGVIQVTIANRSAGYERRYRLRNPTPAAPADMAHREEVLA